LAIARGGRYGVCIRVNLFNSKLTSRSNPL
jgi:hypothetical protein